MPSTPNSIDFQRSHYSQFDRSRNRRLCIDDDAPERDDRLAVSELLPRDSRAFHGTLNQGEEDELTITGYHRSILRTICCWFCIILTGGLLRLVLHWSQNWLLIATHSPCPLDIAEKVLIEENYNGKHTVCYIHKVITLNMETLSKMRNQPGKWDSYFKLCDFDEKSQFYLSMHLSSGHFKHTDTVRLFRCKQLRYIWDDQTRSFQKLKGLDVNVPSKYLHQRKGLSRIEESARRLIYGPNEISVPFKDVLTLLFLEMLNPFYVFQVFSVILWMCYSYYYYATVIVLMSAFGISMSIRQTRKNQNALINTVRNADVALVVHDDGSVEKIDTQYLVPGDVIEIPSTGCTMQCDAVLLSGNCILDESMLTGESVPITKTPLPHKRDLIFDSKEHSRHTLFSGTKVIQTRYIGSEKVLAVVINTGNITAKGGLIRSILYPPPVDYKFERDSYKFIGLLACIAAVGFVYTLVTKIMRSNPATRIIIEALDLITIAVPPALPAAMSVGRFNAQKRLEKQNIYCISPRSINVSGSIDCVCFDKTGTLTEDGLDMWGVVPKSPTNTFQIPLREVIRLPCDHFLYGMVTCHSITLMNGEMKGDPLDLKMFESTGWILEEANVADDNKYDLLFPTIVRQPALDKNRCSTSSLNNVDDFFVLNDIGIVREFSFTSSLQRMSVITRRLFEDHFNVYCKGSPEMIQTLCRKETIPDNYLKELNVYAQQGYRVIAVAYKELDKKIKYPRIQRISRDRIECDLEFLGFVVLENRLKPDTTDVIKNLTAANIRTVMVTGDNILTALSVAKDCGIVTQKQSIITVKSRPNPNVIGAYEIFYNLSGGDNSTTNCAQTPNSIGEVCSLMTNSNSIASIETTDTWTHHDVELGNKYTITDNLYNNYRFALVGKTWSVLRDHFPELIPKIVARGTIFARMSPDQKQQLILEFQNLGYYVAMCGDGANDCGALKAAHTGISLSEAESSVASPFTSKNPTIKCVPDVIREGRAALVTSFGIFKYMAAYSLVQFASVLMLYSIDANLTDIEYLYIDLLLISVFAFFFGQTETYKGPLVKETPLNSLVSTSPIASLLLHLFVAIAFQLIGWYHLQSQSWYIPYTNAGSDDDDDIGCLENYTMFIVSSFQYIILAIVFSKGAPYRKSIVTNYWFLATLIINVCVVVYLAMYPAQFLVSFLKLVLPPDYMFRLYLILYGLANFLISLFIEEFIVEYLLFKKLRYTFHNSHRSRRKYLTIEHELRKDYKWPTISFYQNDINATNADSSPLSYAEISAEHNADNQLPFDQNSSILNSFFDKQPDDVDNVNLSTIDSDSDAEDDVGENIQNINLQTNHILSNNNSCNLQSRNDSGIDFEIMLYSMTNHHQNPSSNINESSTSKLMVNGDVEQTTSLDSVTKTIKNAQISKDDIHCDVVKIEKNDSIHVNMELNDMPLS